MSLIIVRGPSAVVRAIAERRGYTLGYILAKYPKASFGYHVDSVTNPRVVADVASYVTAGAEVTL